MFLEIPDLLTPDEVRAVLDIVAKAPFVDGRVSNPANTAKKNLQLHDNDAYGRSSKILVEALYRHPDFVGFAFPKTAAPPMVTRYEPGMQYGPHSDSAFIALGQRQIRTDLSATIFLADPASYDGGELSVQLGTRRLDFKGAAGSAIVYPSTTMHEVKPVTRGVRIAAITFIESEVADPVQRDALYELNEVAALEGLNMRPENYVRLLRVQALVKRMWATPG
jgi:PKHD-type hydroxylase